MQKQTNLVKLVTLCCEPDKEPISEAMTFLNMYKQGLRGGVIVKIQKIRPDQIIHPDNSEIFELQNYLKNADPLSDQIQTFLNLRHIDGGRPPQTDILKGLFRHIYIENGKIKYFYFYFS